MKKYITHKELQDAATSVAEEILNSSYYKTILELEVPPYHVFGVPRGGITAAYAVVGALNQQIRDTWMSSELFEVTDDMDVAHFVIDDLVDSGATSQRYRRLVPGAPFYALFRKEYTVDTAPPWLVFPWEEEEDKGDASADDICTRLLQYIGEDPSRQGLEETPRRFLNAWRHWTKGYNEEPKELLKSFTDGAEDYDEMVVLSDIPAWSTCEHHLAPIFGVAHVGYIPKSRIVGLSKINRLVDMYGRRLQVQERWTTQIANAIDEVLEPEGVAVIIEARHLCMESRGICQQGTITRTSAVRGALKGVPEARAEFLRLIGK